MAGSSSPPIASARRCLTATMQSPGSWSCCAKRRCRPSRGAPPGRRSPASSGGSRARSNAAAANRCARAGRATTSASGRGAQLVAEDILVETLALGAGVATAAAVHGLLLHAEDVLVDDALIGADLGDRLAIGSIGPFGDLLAAGDGAAGGAAIGAVVHHAVVFLAVAAGADVALAAALVARNAGRGFGLGQRIRNAQGQQSNRKNYEPKFQGRLHSSLEAGILAPTRVIIQLASPAPPICCEFSAKVTSCG